MTGTALARLVLVAVTVLVVQASFVTGIEVFGAHGDLMLLLGIAAGLAAGSEAGALVGFCSGLAVDLVTQTPFGLSALAFCVTGYAVGAMQSSVLRAAWWIPVVITAATSAIGVFAYALVGEVVGQHTMIASELPGIILVVTVLNATLSPLAVRVMRWVLHDRLRSVMSLR